MTDSFPILLLSTLLSIASIFLCLIHEKGLRKFLGLASLGVIYVGVGISRAFSAISTRGGVSFAPAFVIQGFIMAVFAVLSCWVSYRLIRPHYKTPLNKKTGIWIIVALISLGVLKELWDAAHARPARASAVSAEGPIRLDQRTVSALWHSFQNNRIPKGEMDALLRDAAQENNSPMELEDRSDAAPISNFDEQHYFMEIPRKFKVSKDAGGVILFEKRNSQPFSQVVIPRAEVGYEIPLLPTESHVLVQYFVNMTSELRGLPIDRSQAMLFKGNGVLFSRYWLKPLKYRSRDTYDSTGPNKLIVERDILCEPEKVEYVWKSGSTETIIWTGTGRSSPKT